MEADIASVGGFLGSATAAFVASWATLSRKLHTAEEEAKRDQKKLADTNVALEQRLAALEKTLEENRQDVRKLFDRMRNAVTDEEFQAYVRATTEAVNGLTEKVGRTTGAIEAWQRHQR